MQILITFRYCVFHFRLHHRVRCFYFVDFGLPIDLTKLLLLLSITGFSNLFAIDTVASHSPFFLRFWGRAIASAFLLYSLNLISLMFLNSISLMILNSNFCSLSWCTWFIHEISNHTSKPRSLMGLTMGKKVLAVV